MEINEIIKTLITLKQVQKEYCAKHYNCKDCPADGELCNVLGDIEEFVDELEEEGSNESMDS